MRRRRGADKAPVKLAEQALLEQLRSADVWADTDVQCLELPLSDFREFRTQHPETGHCIMTNLPAILSKRLFLANARIDVLSAYWRNGAKDGRIIETED